MSMPVLRPLVVTLLLLLIPFVAMRFGTGMDWTASDFAVMGVMLFVTGVMIEFVAKKGGKYRVPAAVVIAGLFLWLWAELAVGVFTSWGS